MSAFEQQGNTVTFTAAASAPTAVQCTGNAGGRSPQYLITNIGAVTAFVGFSPLSAADAAVYAVVPTGTSRYCLPVLAGSQISFSGPPDAYFTGITSGGSAIVYVTPGYGD